MQSFCGAVEENALQGQAESHGCVRLTNWDVDKLAKLLKKGTEVAFIERSVNPK